MLQNILRFISTQFSNKESLKKSPSPVLSTSITSFNQPQQETLMEVTDTIFKDEENYYCYCDKQRADTCKTTLSRETTTNENRLGYKVVENITQNDFDNKPYLKQNGKIYLFGMANDCVVELKGIDYATFSVMGDFHIQDKNGVYWRTYICDPKDFEGSTFEERKAKYIEHINDYEGCARFR